MSKSLTNDAKRGASSIANPVSDGKVWSSKGFKSFASSKNEDDSPHLRSPWIQRLKPASHWTRLEEGHDIKDMCVDMQTSSHMANQCGTPAPEYENSRRSKQDFYCGPYAVTALDQYSRVLRAAKQRGNLPQSPQLEVRVAPKLLPAVEALLPSYPQKVDTRPCTTEGGNFCTSIKCTGFSNEAKQVVHFSAVDTPRDSIKGLDFRSTIPSQRHLAVCKSLRTAKSLCQQTPGQHSTMLTRPPTNCASEYFLSTTSCSALMNAHNPRGTVEAAAGEKRHSSRYKDRHFYAKKWADRKPSHEPTIPSTQSRVMRSSFACRGNVAPSFDETWHSSTLGSEHDCELDKGDHIEKGIIGASSIRNKFSFGETGTKESFVNYTYHMNNRYHTHMALMNYEAMPEEIRMGDLSCYQMPALVANKLDQKQPGTCLSFGAENVPSCSPEHVEREPSSRSIRNLNSSFQKSNINFAKDIRHQTQHGSFGITREASSSESPGCRSPLPSDFEATVELAQKRFRGEGNVSFPKVVKGDFMSASLSKTNMGADAGKIDQKLGRKVDCTKEAETGHIHASQRKSSCSSWMGYKSYVRGTVYATEFTGLVSPAGGPKSYHGDPGQASGSYSDSCEKMKGGTLSTLNQKTRLPAGHFPPVLRQQSWDYDRQIAAPLSNAFGKEKSLVTHNLWMQRWCAASSKQNSHGHPNENREFKTFMGIPPFSKGDDGAETGSILCSSDNFVLRPAKRICRESGQHTSKKVCSGFQTANQARQYWADGMSSQFMKRFLTPSSAAMAIMGTTARQVHGTQPQRKGLFGMWAAPKPSTLTTPIAQDKTCKDLKALSKSIKESLPKTKPLAPVDM